VSSVNVLILANEDAGRGLSDTDLRLVVQDGGHSVIDVVTDFGADMRVPGDRVELLVAAGGDGTVAAVAAISARASIPLAILPLGTANNIATSLGLGHDIPHLVARWRTAHPTSLDLGHARVGAKQWVVVEGIGSGLIPAGMAAAARALERTSAHPVVEVARAVEIFRDVLTTLQPEPIAISVDGRRISEPLLMVEVLNMPGVGPNLVLAPDATPFDGLFDVVLARPQHRANLLEYLDSRIRGEEHRLSLPVYRAHHVRIESCVEMHVDDERVDTCELGAIDVSMQAGAATVWL
jgi:diacylglycerol kinase family enzyme